MKTLVVVIAVLACALARPQAGDYNDHLASDGGHLWGLSDFHEGGEEEGGERRKRQAAEEGGEGEEGGAHEFHGEHLWGLEDFHIERRKRQAGNHNDHLASDGGHLWGLNDFHEGEEDEAERKKRTAEDEEEDWDPMQNYDSRPFFF